MARELASAATVSQAGEVRSARIESLRALAALGVVFAHIFGTAHRYDFAYLEATLPRRILFGGGAGVYLFFALTGYLLFWPFARRYFAAGEAIDLGHYALNRALRILPLYYVVLVVFMIVQADGGSAGSWARFLLFGENFFSSTVATVDGPMWSLVVELHFYILLPLLAFVLARLARASPARAAVLLLALGVASFYLNWTKVAGVSHVPDPRWQYSLPVTFLFFVPGMLLALLRLGWDRRRPRWLSGPLGRGDVWLVMSLALWVLAVDDFKRAALCAAAAFLSVGACVLPLRRSRLLDALQWRPLALLGVASYSLYLWHDPIVTWMFPSPAHSFWALLAIALPLCVAVALLSYRGIEAPFLRLRKRWTSSPAGPQEPAALAAQAAGP